MVGELAISLLALSAPAAYYWPYALRQVHVRRLRHKLARNRTLILTYDDGPSSSLTPRVLDILGRFDARATFFMLGSSARCFPEIADRVVREGHETGCHSDRHLNAWKVSPRRGIEDVDAGYRVLSPWVRENGTFRPPYGKITLPTYRAVRSRGAGLGWWTIDSGDTRAVQKSSPDDIAAAVEHSGGGIVLLHDLASTQERADFVCKTTERLLDTARRNQISVRTMSEIGCA